MDIAALKEAALLACPSHAECDINCDDPFCPYVHHAVVDAAAERDFVALANPTAILSLIGRYQALEEALGGIKWKSADRDNMEFAARVTCYQLDAIRAALSPTNTQADE